MGSGVTGAEFASAYQALGSQVTLISSRDRVLPHEDPDAAMVVEDVFRRRGMTVLSRSRADGVKREGNGAVVTLADGRMVRGSHCLLTVGLVPATQHLALEDAGVTLDERGFVTVDKVSRTSAAGVYAAGDCTGVMMLASVAAMQGRIAMWHALGEAVQPLRLSYHHRDGRQSTLAAYVGEDTLMASIRRLVTARRTVVHVQVASLQLPGTSRRDLAARCEAAVRGDVARRGHRHALVA